MTGRLIFFTITALPDSEAATSFALNALFAKSRRMASVTAAPSTIAPSTMLSGGIGSQPNAETRNPLPTGFSSIAFTALEPTSSPTTALFLPNPSMKRVPEVGHRQRCPRPDHRPRAKRIPDFEPPFGAGIPSERVQNWKLSVRECVADLATTQNARPWSPQRALSDAAGNCLTVPTNARIIWVCRCAGVSPPYVCASDLPQVVLPTARG